MRSRRAHTAGDDELIDAHDILTTGNTATKRRKDQPRDSTMGTYVIQDMYETSHPRHEQDVEVGESVPGEVQEEVGRLREAQGQRQVQELLRWLKTTFDRAWITVLSGMAIDIHSHENPQLGEK
ncbi:hypothetical protein TI39_contig5835g00002 [Zymoseptoria brevis]|uniref:Uncharacterized protein n=1 Tax=Zymoseptoria brevis TaxID=1047168 RepID=A0A0F4G6G7_9PEZI|nr:hypothetical protein TI39_contig5835g00002 [Zymoseptoria brevis]